MKTYILINTSDNNNILGVYTDRTVACTMMRVFGSTGDSIVCQTMEVTNKVPAWAERVIELI